MAKKTSFRSAISPFGPNLVPKILFLDFFSTRCQKHCCKLSLYPITRKTNKPNMRKRQKENQFQGPFQPVLTQIWSSKKFLCVLPLLDVMHCCKLSLYAILRKTDTQNLRKLQKNQFWDQFLPLCPKVGPRNEAKLMI